MSKRVWFEIKFDSGNQAVVDDPQGETVRILTKLAKEVSRGYRDGFVADANGNKIGIWFLHEDEI